MSTTFHNECLSQSTTKSVFRIYCFTLLVSKTHCKRFTDISTVLHTYHANQIDILLLCSITASHSAMSVSHSARRLEFLLVQNGLKSFLKYRLLPGNIMEMYHTEVPSELRGRGIGKQLCSKAFDYAIQNELRVRPTCSYVAKYARESTKPSEKKIIVWN
ncbi:hypothetical protein AB6A40_006688 [Gnathostoma spinigerum]|uniref:Protein NATD1 n=1 Tax=Gnathostoma spinigerum TaxID=75299 RepID=A0ABD6EJ35_9BILA